MPSYSVTVRNGDLSEGRKVAVAQAITRVHGEVTDTPFYMAQVLINEIAPDCYFLGGATLDGDQIFVHGSTREGRTRETKDLLIERLTEDVATAAGVDRRHVWVYIAEMPARQTIDFSRVLPAPGEEAAWNDAWSAEDKAHFSTVGMSSARH
jgi:phenylpyruvate tautomerase PptA (4-oxalocrotonate tautomerase family)